MPQRPLPGMFVLGICILVFVNVTNVLTENYSLSARTNQFQAEGSSKVQASAIYDGHNETHNDSTVADNEPPLSAPQSFMTKKIQANPSAISTPTSGGASVYGQCLQSLTMI